MREPDYGYFGTGDMGYAQYMTAFERSFGSADTDFDRESGEDAFESDFSDDSTDDSDF